jgi:hypothetical protein
VCRFRRLGSEAADLDFIIAGLARGGGRGEGALDVLHKAPSKTSFKLNLSVANRASDQLT